MLAWCCDGALHCQLHKQKKCVFRTIYSKLGFSLKTWLIAEMKGLQVFLRDFSVEDVPFLYLNVSST